MSDIKTTLPKPKIGEPCNGCGLCCAEKVCMNGAYVLKLVDKLGDTIAGPCPALVAKKDGSYGCGIVETPKKYIKDSKYPKEVLSKNFSFMIGSGRGCDHLLKNDHFMEMARLQRIIGESLADLQWQKKCDIANKVIHGII